MRWGGLYATIVRDRSRQYIDVTGRNPFERWFDALNETAQAKVLTHLRRLGTGNVSSLKGVHAGVFELRIDFGPGYRIYIGKDGETLVILLGGGTKKRQHLDIVAAQQFW